MDTDDPMALPAWMRPRSFRVRVVKEGMGKSYKTSL